MLRLLFSAFTLSAIGAMAKGDGDFLEEPDFLKFASEDESVLSPLPIAISQSFSTDADLIFADDVEIQRYTAEYDITRGNTTFGLSYSRTLYDVDFTFPGFDGGTLSDEANTYSLALAHEWNDRLSSSVTVGGYEGFTSFRSLWFPAFFNINSGGQPGFREQGDPFGVSVAIGNTYTFANEIDNVNLTLSYSRDRIVPAQQFQFGPQFGPPNFSSVVTGDDTLDTFAAALTGNFYLTSKITSQWSARFSHVSDRRLRTQLRWQVAWNLLDDLTLRGEYGLTIEPPDFEAFFGGIKLDYQILDNLSVALGFRIYTDSGEITTANFNSSAPAFDSREISLAVRWSNGAHTLSSSIAYLDTNFDPVGFANFQFSDLFSDREFVAIRAAYTYEF